MLKLLLLLTAALFTIVKFASAGEGDMGYYHIYEAPKDCELSPCPQFRAQLLNNKEKLEKTTFQIEGIYYDSGYEYDIPNFGDIIYGKVVPYTYKGYPDVHHIIINKEYKHVTQGTNRKFDSNGPFYMFSDNLVRCVDTPCFSINATLLNRNENMVEISEIIQIQQEKIEIEKLIAVGNFKNGKFIIKESFVETQLH